MTLFQSKVYNIVKKIPKGKVLSYRDVAEKLGNPKAYRAVGSALKKNFNSEIPCHRVVKVNGKIGQYNRGVEKKLELLKGEGVIK